MKTNEIDYGRMIDCLKTFIETARLLLVPVSTDFEEEIFREFTPEITVYMFPKPPEKIEETKEFIESSLEKMGKEEQLQMVVLRKETREFLGCAGLHRINTPTPEFGIWIKKSAHGNGYGKEAIIGLKKWADDNLPYEYLVYPVDRDNIPSRKIPESLGGIIGREYDKKNLSGNILHEVEYRIYRTKERKTFLRFEEAV